MKRSNIIWTVKTLDHFLAKPPKDHQPGVPGRAERQALIAYLQAANRGAECHGPR